MKRIFITVLLVSAAFCAHAQNWKKLRQEYIFGLGAANFLGDLGGADQIGTHLMKDLEFSLTKFAAVAGYRYKYTPSIAAKITTSYFKLAGNDQLTLEPARNNRNLSFQTNIFEVAGVFEYSLIEERLKGRYSRRRKKIPPNVYVFAGLEFFYMNPKAQLNGRWFELRDFGTEGQGLVAGTKKYSLVQAAIPLGIGIKYPLTREWSIGLEYCMRKTFTDYIDDVSTVYFDKEQIRSSRGDIAYFADPTNNKIPGGTAAGQQRGDPSYNDSFLTTNLYLSYKITRRKSSRVKF